MKILNPDKSLDKFFNGFGGASEKILMLDYDGTLAPFVTDRDKAYPYPGVRPRLTRLLTAEKTRTIIISGRSIETLKGLLGLDPMPELWGCHGAEKLTREGGYKQANLDPKVYSGLEIIKGWAKSVKLIDILEIKPAGLAFHWRGFSGGKVEQIRQLIESQWESPTGDYDLVLHEFDGGLEVRAAGVTKAGVVRTIIKDSPTDAAAAYLGDDWTDEDAFKALGDNGLNVLVRPQLRTTAADLWLSPPDELYLFLDRWLESEKGTREDSKFLSE